MKSALNCFRGLQRAWTSWRFGRTRSRGNIPRAKRCTWTRDSNQPYHQCHLRHGTEPEIQQSGTLPDGATGKQTVYRFVAATHHSPFLSGNVCDIPYLKIRFRKFLSVLRNRAKNIRSPTKKKVYFHSFIHSFRRQFFRWKMWAWGSSCTFGAGTLPAKVGHTWYFFNVVRAAEGDPSNDFFEVRGAPLDSSNLLYITREKQLVERRLNNRQSQDTSSIWFFNFKVLDSGLNVMVRHLHNTRVWIPTEKKR